ncbi:hypothetical protein [Citrobacter freundii]|uniref:hypothetical protein n=1 Tax=Citrobacter freundii TaxID=546 RepID=UPI00374EFADC
MTTNHPANGPVSLDRLHQISEILSKAAAQSDGGNLGYAMADAVKVIDGAIAAFGAEPVADVVAWNREGEERTCDIRLRRFDLAPGPLFAVAQPATVVPDEKPMPEASKMYAIDAVAAIAEVRGWNACRSAMLQAGNSPVTPDDVRRMDWLVSKTVNVREPMVYGSHSLFWSQTITDEEDDYHATKLREQIDEAMAAERAAAPQQEA